MGEGNPKVCVVIPTYNERENIGSLLERLLAVSSSHGINLQVLVVDDNSPDGTADLVEEFAGKTPNIRLLRRPGKLGLGSAYKEGFTKALRELKAEILVEMDADGSHHPEQLPSLLSKISEGYDVVVGSRYVAGGSIKGWSLKRKLTSAGANLLARKLCGLRVKDATSGFRAFKASALKRIGLERLSASGYAFQIETLYWAARLGLKIGETPITFTNRLKAKSKLNLGEILAYTTLCFRLFLKRLLRP